MRRVSTRIECDEDLLPLVLKRMPAGEYTIFCQTDLDEVVWEAQNKAYGEIYAEAGLGALASASAVNVVIGTPSGGMERALIDENHDAETSRRAAYSHNYLGEGLSEPVDYYDRVDTYSIGNRKLLIDDALEGL